MGRAQRIFNKEADGVALIVGIEREESLIRIAVVKIDLLDASDDVGDVSHLAVPLTKQLVVHIAEEVVVFAFLRGRINNQGGNALKVL